MAGRDRLLVHSQKITADSLLQDLACGIGLQLLGGEDSRSRAGLGAQRRSFGFQCAANSAPTPEEHPVTRATFPCVSISCFSLTPGGSYGQGGGATETRS